MFDRIKNYLSNIWTEAKLQVYMRELEKQGLSKQEIRAKLQRSASISARVYRAQKDEWEDLGVISGPEVDPLKVAHIKQGVL